MISYRLAHWKYTDAGRSRFDVIILLPCLDSCDVRLRLDLTKNARDVSDGQVSGYAERETSWWKPDNPLQIGLEWNERYCMVGLPITRRRSSLCEHNTADSKPLVWSYVVRRSALLTVWNQIAYLCITPPVRFSVCCRHTRVSYSTVCNISSCFTIRCIWCVVEIRMKSKHCTNKMPTVNKCYLLTP